MLRTIDWTIMIVYFVFVLGIGAVLKRYMKTSTDFFLAGRSIPAWVAGLAFISANLGAQEVIGMGASGAKYGIATSHFYWIGAIPAMVFVGVFMMPFYYGSRARSVPEYLRLRFDEKTRGFNAVSFAVMTVFSSGISMYAMAKLIQILHIFDAPFAWLGLPQAWIFHVCSHFGPHRARLHLPRRADQRNLQRGAAVLPDRRRLPAAGLAGPEERRRLGRPARPTLDPRPTPTPGWAWRSAAHQPLGVEWFGLAMGLGFVLSFGYWCTDFLVVQRAMAADSMSAARRTPLIAALPKMFFPFLVILPGLIAIALPTQNLGGLAGIHGAGLQASGRADPGEGRRAHRQADARQDGAVSSTTTWPFRTCCCTTFPPACSGSGLTALLASFMSGMAGNVTAFNTVWTYDIYQAYIQPTAQRRALPLDGAHGDGLRHRAVIAAAYVATQFNNIMDMLQLVFAFVNAPLFATFLLGMFWKRATGHGAFRPARGHHGRRAPPRPDAAPGAVAGIKGGWLGHHARLSQRDGAELLDRHLRLDHLLPGHDRGEPGDPAARRRRAGRPGLLAHRASDAARPSLVSKASGAGGCGAGGHRVAQYCFPVNFVRRSDGTRHSTANWLPVLHLWSVADRLRLAERSGNLSTLPGYKHQPRVGDCYARFRRNHARPGQTRDESLRPALISESSSSPRSVIFAHPHS